MESKELVKGNRWKQRHQKNNLPALFSGGLPMLHTLFHMALTITHIVTFRSINTKLNYSFFQDQY